MDSLPTPPHPQCVIFQSLLKECKVARMSELPLLLKWGQLTHWSPSSLLLKMHLNQQAFCVFIFVSCVWPYSVVLQHVWPFSCVCLSSSLLPLFFFSVWEGFFSLSSPPHIVVSAVSQLECWFFSSRVTLRPYGVNRVGTHVESQTGRVSVTQGNAVVCFFYENRTYSDMIAVAAEIVCPSARPSDGTSVFRRASLSKLAEWWTDYWKTMRLAGSGWIDCLWCNVSKDFPQGTKSLQCTG